MEISSNILGPQVAYLRRKWRLNYFVETGTAHGDTAELAAVCFDKVFTCEIDPALAVKARQKLVNYPHVEVFEMPSPEFLRQIKRRLNQPTMYWLDAHWCGGPVKPAKECPLLDELAEIGSLHGHSVILIDDVNYMLSPPPSPHDPKQWPTMTQLEATFGSWKEDLILKVEQGPRSKVLIVTPSQARPEPGSAEP